MIEELRSETTATCDGENCDRRLADEPTLTFRTAAGERQAYECRCGGVTVTVAREPEPTR